MKKAYEKPVFYAERYEVNASIAACDYHVGENVSPDPITIQKGDSMCPVGDKGHHAGKGNIPSNNYPLTLFNDGTSNQACQYDWDGSTITGPNGNSVGNFGNAFYGATANNENHRPAYKGVAFFS